MKVIKNQNEYLIIKENINGKDISILSLNNYFEYIDDDLQYISKTMHINAFNVYFEFLEKINLNYKDIDKNTLVDFIDWLKLPYIKNKESNEFSLRTGRDIKFAVNLVKSFYDFLYNTNQIKEPKSNIDFNKNLILRDFNIIYNKLCNLRDKLILRLIFETKLNIHDILRIYHEDIVYKKEKGYILKIINREDDNIKLKKEIVVSDEIINLYNDYCYNFLDTLEIYSGPLFIKLRGIFKGEMMDYQEVNALFKRLKKKTNIHIPTLLLKNSVL